MKIYRVLKTDFNKVSSLLGGYIFHRTQDEFVLFKLASTKFENIVFGVFKDNNISVEEIKEQED